MTVETPQRDSGAALLLAIGFVLMVGIVSAGLIGLVTSSVNNRNALELVRNRQYAADGAIERAISQVRGLPCGSAGLIDDILNGVSITVKWVPGTCLALRTSNGSAVTQRTVDFSASCKTATDPSCNFADVIIRATVSFRDDPPMSYVQSWSVNR